eukprot:64344-Amorphochlora_amoeboformis.AAC.2
MDNSEADSEAEAVSPNLVPTPSPGAGIRVSLAEDKTFTFEPWTITKEGRLAPSSDGFHSVTILASHNLVLAASKSTVVAYSYKCTRYVALLAGPPGVEISGLGFLEKANSIVVTDGKRVWGRSIGILETDGSGVAVLDEK